LVSRDRGDAAKFLAAPFLDAHCPGTHGISEADKAKLKKIAATVAYRSRRNDARLGAQCDQIALLPLRW
jgi:hypothetical protein